MPNRSRSRTEPGQGAARVTPTGGFVDLEATADGGDVGRSREETAPRRADAAGRLGQSCGGVPLVPDPRRPTR